MPDGDLDASLSLLPSSSASDGTGEREESDERSDESSSEAILGGLDKFEDAGGGVEIRTTALGRKTWHATK